MELVWEDGGQEFSVPIGADRPEVTFGRLSDCDIHVSRASVSRRHAVFTWSQGGVVVADQNSTAGTFVDGKRVTRQRIEPGTVVNCGGVMVLLDDRPSGKAAPASRSGGEPSFASQTLSGLESRGGRGGAKDADLDALFDGPLPSRRRGQEPEPKAAPKGALKDADLDALFDGPMPSRRGGGGGAPEPVSVKKNTGFDAGSFFGSSDDEDEDLWAVDGEARAKPRAVEAERAVAQVVAAPEPAVVQPAKVQLAAYLLYVDDQGQDSEVRVERDLDPIVIGRRAGAAIKVHNPSVSGKHCQVAWVGEDIEVRDLGSSNGTFINGERIRRGVLRDGDILRCGRFELRMSFVAQKDIAQAEYEAWGDDWGDDDFDLGQADFHIVFRDNRGQLTAVTMGASERRLACGSRGCEILLEGRSVEAEHCELEWDDGILIVKDLDSDTGTFVNDEPVEGEETLRNGDVLVVGRARLRVARGASPELSGPRPESQSEEALRWARYLDHADDDLELLFIDGELDDEGGRLELSIWGNGESRVEIVTTSGRSEVVGVVDRDLRRVLYNALLKAGFPDARTKKQRPGEVPAELTMFQGREEAKLALVQKLTQRSPAYHEALELLRAIAGELAAGA